MKILRELLLENWTLKLAAIFLALILWLFVRADSGGERVITVPLEVQITREMEVTNERPSTVDVTVLGTSSNTWFGQSIPTCTINLKGYDEGEHVVPLARENVHIPRASGLEIIRINPARVILVLERTISKEVPVVVSTRGDPASGFDLYGKSAFPSAILITGPRSHLEKIDRINTEPVSLTGQTQPIRAFANLNIRDNMVRSTPVGPIEVEVILGVHRRLATIPRVAVRVDDIRYTTVPKSISVDLLVPVSFKESLDSSDFTATVSTSNLAESRLPARVKPEVKFSTPRDPAIVIKDVQPVQVTLLRK